MFSTRFKNKYDLTYHYPEEDSAQSHGIVEAQLAFLHHLIDETEVPPEIENMVYGTDIKVGTLREAVRYAQDRCAAVVIAVVEQDIECERLGMPAEYGDRFTFYRNVIENTRSTFPRGQHIGDETWLKSAQPQELIEEATNCVNERYYMQGVWENMDKYIKVHKGYKERRKNGLVSVYNRSERKRDEDEKALVKWAGTSTSTRGGRYTRNANRGGRSEGSFRGWK